MLKDESVVQFKFKYFLDSRLLLIHFRHLGLLLFVTHLLHRGKLSLVSQKLICSLIRIATFQNLIYLYIIYLKAY